ncbi:MAG: magnesium/cobalt transporter CorA [Desulfobacterales bacterium]|nr:MAG: magnesium/cobalt transporter CorA [Desulfobacterales bacterium]
MPKFIKKMSKKAGAAPGTLVHIGEKKIDKVRIRLIDYDEKQLQEEEFETIEACFPCKEEPTVSWINIDGLHDIETIQKLGKHFNIHPLVLEDIVNTGQRPKAEDFDDYAYIVLKMLHYDVEERQVRAEQFSLILGSNFLISFQERVGDVFEQVRERIRKGKGRIRKAGVDYLAYALMDAIVDKYFVIMEVFGEKVEALEEELVENPTSRTLETIHTMKREMIYFRKQVWPLREVVGSLVRGEFSLVSETTAVYLRDVHDHTIQVIDTLESLRDVLGGMLDLYLSTISNRMNEVMKVLTIIATIFIPLSFAAGIYGMNFKYMPELEWQWGYFMFWGFIVVIVIAMVAYFKKKAWL